MGVAYGTATEHDIFQEENVRISRALRQLLDKADRPSDLRGTAEAIFSAGLAFVQAPDGHGGLGVHASHQRAIDESLEKAGLTVPDRAGIGFGMAVPTLLAHGREDQWGRFLRPLFLGDESWCQLFSEPTAGSDIAGLATRADRYDDHWVVNGQKLWTSNAHVARWGLLVARTDPDAPKHRGLTYFVCDMHAPGVEVRRLRQMTGAAEFNEVFFSDVVIPDSMRLGEVGQGWGIALTTLENERANIGSRSDNRAKDSITHLLRLWRERAPDHRVLTDRVIACWCRSEANGWLKTRLAQERGSGGKAARAALGKLAFGETVKEAHELCMDLLAAEGMTYPAGADGYGSWAVEDFDQYADPRVGFLRSRGNSIGGGTAEILRNVIAERVLGLPPEPRLDKTVPWRDVPRN